jgi:hypothetical protein
MARRARRTRWLSAAASTVAFGDRLPGEKWCSAQEIQSKPTSSANCAWSRQWSAAFSACSGSNSSFGGGQLAHRLRTGP